MHRVELAVLKAFQKNPHAELSTTDLVRAAVPEEYEQSQTSTLRKGKLHRKTLYHIHKLVQDGILKITRFQARGEKLYALAAPEGEIIIQRKNTKVLINKPHLSVAELERYERSGILTRFEPQAWESKINAVLLHANKTDGPHHLRDRLKDFYAEVNDALGVYGFEQFINEKPLDVLEEFLHDTDLDTKDYLRHLSLFVNLDRLDQAKAVHFIKSYAHQKPRRVHLVFTTTQDSLYRSSALLKRIIALFSEHFIKINLHDAKHPPPLIGKGGIHSMNSQDWHEHLKNPDIGAALSQFSMAVDAHEFFTKYPQAKDLRVFLEKVSKTLLKASSMQRRHTRQFYPAAYKHADSVVNFFKYRQNYVRFWNYAWDAHENHLHALQDAKSALEDFCVNEETIFKSCGIPLRFRIALGSAFVHFAKLSGRRYRKPTVHSLQDLESEQIQKGLQARAWMNRVLDGGDRVRIFRSGNLEPERILDEFHHLLGYQFPLTTYDFRQRTGNVKLTEYYNAP